MLDSMSHKPLEPISLNAFEEVFMDLEGDFELNFE